jgi:hypothetical protein
MPMDKEELQGTCADGSASREYCTYCYQNGAFTNPDLTLDEMISRIAQAVGKTLTPEEKKNSREFLSRLKRWKS